jgi:hypothetical protein
MIYLFIYYYYYKTKKQIFFFLKKKTKQNWSDFRTTPEYNGGLPLFSHPQIGWGDNRLGVAWLILKLMWGRWQSHPPTTT